jgi:hypothetical protein
MADEAELFLDDGVYVGGGLVGELFSGSARLVPDAQRTDQRAVL